MEQAVLTAGWDGEWFRRAYDAFGQPVGGKECDEGQIFIEPQGMCVMAGIGKDTGQAARALKSVEEQLDTKYGVMLLQPAYTTYRLNLGEISSYPPDTRKTPASSATTTPGSAALRRCWATATGPLRFTARPVPPTSRTFRKFIARSPTSTARWWPAETPPTFGEAKNSWLTGTAAWTFVNVSQYILGIQPTLDGLKIDPCIPHEMDGFTLRRVWRGATYEIVVENPDHLEKGVKAMTVDGKPVSGNILPLFPPAQP